jgi:hypothetical protein
MNAKEIKFEDVDQVKKLSDQMDLYRQEKGLVSGSLLITTLNWQGFEVIF